jgi:hypothetical protein
VFLSVGCEWQLPERRSIKMLVKAVTSLKKVGTYPMDLSVIAQTVYHIVPWYGTGTGTLSTGTTLPGVIIFNYNLNHVKAQIFKRRKSRCCHLLFYL